MVSTVAKPRVFLGVQLYLNLPYCTVVGHHFCGYYFEYPSEERHLGLVSTIGDDPPMLNWIFVDQDIHMVRHSGCKDTVGHVIGPWGWSEDEQLLILEGGGMTHSSRRGTSW
jgi:hypothetical protein